MNDASSIKNFALLTLCVLMGSGLATADTERVSVAIGTGSATGVYYPTGKAIEKIVNQTADDTSLEVKTVATGGSVFNVNAINVGDLEFGIVQSDRQYQAWNGIKDWEDLGKQTKLRSICSFYPESVVLIAGDDTGIEALADIKGKHVNIGNFGSGPRGNAIDSMQSCGIDWRSGVNAESIRVTDATLLLQQGKLDAFFYTVGHPNDSIKKATAGKRKVHFVPLIGECIDRLITKWPYYAKASIPVRFYPDVRNRQNVETFGVKATFCTGADIPKGVVYLLTKIIFDHLEAFKKLHPAFRFLTRRNMLEALTAPIHPGAMKYYRENKDAVPASTDKERP